MEKGTSVVDFDILDRDANGRAPDDPKFDTRAQSCLHLIAKCKDKVGSTIIVQYPVIELTQILLCALQDLINHDVVQLLLYTKWRRYVLRFLGWASFNNVYISPNASIYYSYSLLLIHRIEFLLYMVQVLFLTLAVVLAARKSDPRQYNEPVDVFRGLCEAISVLIILWNGVFELIEMTM